MIETDLETEYTALLGKYLSDLNEKHLLAAQGLGRVLVKQNIPVEEIGTLHADALDAVMATAPTEEILENTRSASTVVLELLMAYGLAQRERSKQLEKRERSLIDSERRFRSLFEGSNQGILVHCNNIALQANESLARMFGFESVEEILTLPSVLDLLAPDEQERIKQYYELRIKGKLDLQEYEVKGVKKDGTIFWLSNRVFRIAWSGLPAICSTMFDITARKRAEEQLRQAQKMEAVGQLTSGVAHDFNNLLAATMGNAELLEQKLKGRDDLQSLTVSIVKAAARGAELTHRLLAFSRSQSLQPISIQLGALCEGMDDLLKRSLGETIEIVLTADDETWGVAADPSQVESTLLNLAINASHAMPDGGKLAITIKNAPVTDREWAEHWEGRPGEYVALKVSDTGTGIPADVLSHVFEPFFTTKEVGQGSGLGLSMVYGFAQQSGGFATIDSTEGQGTTVTIYLPKASPNQAVTEAPTTDAEMQEGRGEIVMLIEDDPAVRNATQNILKMLGYTVLMAKDGTSALEILSNDEPIDLLLSDMILPGGMDGIDIYKILHQQRPELKCLFMTGYASLLDRKLPEGTKLLPKPVAMAELANQIRLALDA